MFLQGHHHHGSSANAPQQQFQQSLPPTYPPPLYQQQPPIQQGVALAGQGYSSHARPPSLDNTNRGMPAIGNAHPGQKVHAFNIPVPHRMNVPFPKALHSQAPSQYGHIPVHVNEHPKVQASSIVRSNVPHASQQTNPRAQDHHHAPVQKSSASLPFENPPDNQAILVENPLMDNIDQDIAEVAGEVRNMSGPPSIVQDSLHQDQQKPQGEPAFEIPFDPNLTCSKCEGMFRHGEIQKLRNHFDQCRGKPWSRLRAFPIALFSISNVTKTTIISYGIEIPCTLK